MATIANLVVKGVVDPSGIDAGLRRATAVLQSFGKTTNQILAGAFAADVKPDGARIAVQLVAGLTEELQRANFARQEALFRGLIDQKQFKLEGAVAAKGFNDGLLDGMRRIESTGLMTDQIKRGLMAEFNTLGVGAGQQLAAGFQSVADQVAVALNAPVQAATQQVAAAARAAAGTFTQTASVFSNMSRGMARNISSIGFAFAGLAANSERSISGLMRAMSNFALMMGPKGLVVGGVLAGLSSIVDMVRKTGNEAKKMAEDFNQSLRQMVEQSNIAGLLGERVKLLRGTYDVDTGEFVNGLSAMRTELQQIERTQGKFAGFNKRWQELTPIIAAAEAQMRKLDLAIETALRHKGPTELKTVTIEGKTNEQLASKAEQIQNRMLDGLRERVTAVVAAYDQLGPSMGLLTRMKTVHDDLNAVLDRQSDKFGEVAGKIRGMIDELKGAGAIDVKINLDTNVGEMIGTMIQRMLSDKPVAGFEGSSVVTGARADANSRALGETLSAGIKSYIVNPMRPVERALSGFRQQLTETGRGIAQQFKDVGVNIASQFTPAGLAATMLAGVLEGLQPLLNVLKEPLRLVGEILGKALAPVLKAMFPIFKFVAIAATYVGEIFFRVAAAILIAVGSLTKGIGKLINILPGSPGNPLVRAGQQMIDMGKGFNEGARELARGRDELKKLEWDKLNEEMNGTADAAARLTESLLNVPQGFKVALARFEATAAIVSGTAKPPTVPAPPPEVEPPGRGGGGGGGRGGPEPEAAMTYLLAEGAVVVQAARGENVRQLVDDIEAEIQRRSRARSGDVLAGPAGLIR